MSSNRRLALGGLEVLAQYLRHKRDALVVAGLFLEAEE